MSEEKPSIAKTIHSASEHANNRECCESVHWPMKQLAKSKKGFEAARLGVFAITGPLLTHLNCGIRVEAGVQVLLGEQAKTDSRARNAKPGDFLDPSIINELHKEGFIKALWATK